MPEGLNLCGPGATATENKQCLPVIRTLLRRTDSAAWIGFMFEEWAQQYFDHLHYSAYRTLQTDVSVLLFLEIK